MDRVAPSAILRQEIEKLLTPGPRISGGDPAGELIRLAARVVLQDAVEAEQADFIGRDRYEPGHLDTAEGRLEVRVPQVRRAEGPYRSKLMGFLGQHTEVLSKLATEM